MYADEVDKRTKEIHTVEDLQNISEDLTGTYKLMKDIDLERMNWQPIGDFTNGYHFTGTLDGNGYEIKNLKINTEEIKNKELKQSIGLFSSIKGGVIRNLIINNVDIDSHLSRVGALSGFIQDSKIENVNVKGEINIKSSTGSVGGLSGYVTKTNIKKVGISGTGSVDGSTNVGGLIGTSNDSTIESSYVEDININGENQFTSGLVGYILNAGTDSYIKDSYVKDCNINEPENNIKGLFYVGRGKIIVENSYIASDSPVRLFSKYSYGTNISVEVINSFYDMSRSSDKRQQEYGRTTKEMMEQSTYEGFDFENIWIIDEGKSYPTLQNKKTDPENPNPEPIENDFIEGFIGLKDVVISKNNEVSINVDEKATEILINIKVAYGATWVLYEDKELTKKIESNIINLTEDISEAYIEVILADGTKGIFSVKVFKKPGSVIDPSLPVVKGKVTYSYDKVGRLIEVLYESGDKIIYTYDAAGNILEIKKQI